ncbi:hypothetical protein GCM10022419_008010 [Nonomuraea rosea]|uniref:Helix-turn-helix domain-containing protein n=1 Tax=Nonomuraea rosea TaxID=638574 RepID=A0ABP6VD46_9ACTN
MTINKPLGKPPEVAKYLGVSEETLKGWRWKGVGPDYVPVGRHVRYRWSAVEKWLDQQAARRSA